MSRAGRQLASLLIDIAHEGKPAQAHHRLTLERHPAAHQSGVAALRDQRQAGLPAQHDHRRGSALSPGRITIDGRPLNRPDQSTA